jgi:xanthine/CO dehydrogenase XdhC/CoxF family maturation factor
MDRNILEAICQAQKSKERLALVTVVNTLGSTPRKAGSRMLVWPDGRTMGTIGGGCAESDVRIRALTALDSGLSLLYRVEMLNDVAATEGMVCGGVMEVFIQVV